jgi:CCR4-NOT transcription complex subunit 4
MWFTGKLPLSRYLRCGQADIQICQFCYNKLLGSDSRCPGCRRPYDAKAVIFQPVDFEE